MPGTCSYSGCTKPTRVWVASTGYCWDHLPARAAMPNAGDPRECELCGKSRTWLVKYGDGSEKVVCDEHVISEFAKANVVGAGKING